MRKIVLSLIIVLFFSVSFTQSVLSDPITVKIGVLAKRGYARCLSKWGPTAQYLSETLPEYNFEIVPLSFAQITPAVENKSVDFILANSSIYIGLEVNYGVNRIATLKNKRLDGTYTTFGGVIFSLREKSKLKKLNDLKGKTFMAVDETSFGGWRMAWRELQEHGIDPYTDFSELRFGGTHDAVVFAVLNGEIDAGTVRTDTLERMAFAGLVDLEELYVFQEHLGGMVNLPFLHSTREYPEWPFAKLLHTDTLLAEKVAIELIRMPEDSESAKAALSSGWTIPLNYQSVHDCLKALNLPPYIKSSPTVLEIILRIWPFLVIFILILFMLTAWIYIYRKLNNKLLDSEERYRSLSDAAFEGVLLSKKGVVIEVNKALRKMLHYQSAEVVGKKITDFISEEEKEKVKGQVVNNHEGPYETLMLKKDGSVLPVEVSSKLSIYKGEQVRVSAIRDLTEKKKAEEEIQTLQGIIPICSHCKEIRDDKGYWNILENYIQKHSEAVFSHSICDKCLDKYYPEYDD